MVYLQTTNELCFGEAYIEYFKSCEFPAKIQISKPMDVSVFIVFFPSEVYSRLSVNTPCMSKLYN